MNAVWKDETGVFVLKFGYGYKYDKEDFFFSIRFETIQESLLTDNCRYVKEVNKKTVSCESGFNRISNSVVQHPIGHGGPFSNCRIIEFLCHFMVQ